MTQEQQYITEPWRSEHITATFASGMGTIDRYIKEQAHRDMSSHASLVFVFTEPEQNIVSGYYTLSSLSVIFAELPEKTQKKLPRYPQIGATLLGRLGVDRSYRELKRQKNEQPRLGELLLVDAQKRVVQGARETAGSTMMIVDAELPTAAELDQGIRDPITFYPQYGFQRFPGNERRFFKLTRLIEREFEVAAQNVT